MRILLAVALVAACGHHDDNVDASGGGSDDAPNLDSGGGQTVHTFPTASAGACMGKISYLGGHQYQTTVPVTSGSQSQGTRMFLNALFEAQCVTGP